MDFPDSGDGGSFDEILLETFMGKSSQGEHPKQGSEDSSWNWSSRPWERNEDIVQYINDENKKTEFIERNRKAMKNYG